jgi:hypothetical protein
LQQQILAAPTADDAPPPAISVASRREAVDGSEDGGA